MPPSSNQGFEARRPRGIMPVMPPALVAIVLLALAASLLVAGRGFWAWVLAAFAGLTWWWMVGPASLGAFRAVSGTVAVLVLLFGLRPVRAAVFGGPLLGVMRRILPRMGDTERIALEAGTVWWDAELFSGRPRWKTLLDFKPAALTERERAFLAGPVEELCAMVDDWAVTQQGDLAPPVWEFIQSKGFMGMIIPQEYGGLGFSAAAHSAVIAKLSTRSVTASVSVMVPNSLGPAELLHRYGTEEQKRRWLPPLAVGKEIPCFALTGPENGSDAAAMGATGVVCRGKWEGKDVLGMRLNWTKRYTTLGPVATLIGVAFRLYDPDGLLGGASGGGDLGITLALVPAKLPGVEIGKRHDPLGAPFLNGPNEGRDVFVPLDAIIGGRTRAGDGWRMLMDCLAAGRSISLPSLSAGGLQLTTRAVSAYAVVRQQFNLSIGKFEGVEERLARIAGLTYLADAARVLTAGAVDAGQQPAVLSAICKCYLTEAMRTGVNDGMDVLGGAGISRGPRNMLARLYQAVPIGITVEGANILTRSLIIYGQGAIRCHPFVHEEMESAAAGDKSRLDRAFFGHVNFVACSAARAVAGALTGGGAPALRGAGGPVRSHWVRRDFGRLSRLSACFALTSDTAMATLGGNLKRREMISGRLADALAWMYLASAALKRHVDEGEPAALEPAARWAAEHALRQARAALHGTLDNLPARAAAWGLRLLCFPWGRGRLDVSDRDSERLARALLADPALRDGLTRDVFMPKSDEPGLAAVERARAAVLAGEAADRKLRDAVKGGKMSAAAGAAGPAASGVGHLRARSADEARRALLDRAATAGILARDEYTALAAADAARAEAIAVDAFEPDEYRRLRG